MGQQVDLESDVPLSTAVARPLSASVERDADAASASYSTPILLTCAAVAIIGILWHTLYTSLRADDDPPVIPQWTLRFEPGIEPEPVEQIPTVPSPPPVRVRNAFDESEVFEFPGGTSQEEARKAVADILRRRALERQ